MASLIHRIGRLHPKYFPRKFHWTILPFINRVKFHLPSRRKEMKRTPDAVQLINNLHEYSSLLQWRKWLRWPLRLIRKLKRRYS